MSIYRLGRECYDQAVAWEIPNYAYLRTAFFNNVPSDEVFVKLTNAYLQTHRGFLH